MFVFGKMVDFIYGNMLCFIRFYWKNQEWMELYAQRE